jgi:hypothetical protein
MIAVAIMGIIFGILGIFTIGIVFVPLAALCAVVALIGGGIVRGQSATGFLAILAGILAGVGFAASPTLWLATAATLAH